MATKKVYDECCQAMQKNRMLGWKHYSFNKKGELVEDRRPPLRKLFRRKCLVTKSEFDRCSKSEKRRHLFEDELIRQHYLKCGLYSR